MGLLLESTLRLNSQFRGHDFDLLSGSQKGRVLGIAMILLVVEGPDAHFS